MKRTLLCIAIGLKSFISIAQSCNAPSYSGIYQAISSCNFNTASNYLTSMGGRISYDTVEVSTIPCSNCISNMYYTRDFQFCENDPKLRFRVHLRQTPSEIPALSMDFDMAGQSTYNAIFNSITNYKLKSPCSDSPTCGTIYINNAPRKFWDNEGNMHYEGGGYPSGLILNYSAPYTSDSYLPFELHFFFSIQ